MTRRVDILQQEAGSAPSTIWGGSSGDFALAPPSDASSPAGLVADQALLSALTLALFSDARGTPDPIDPASIDLRGWPGDGFDIDPARGEAPLGSALWLQFRRPVNDETARMAAASQRLALEPLIKQGLLGSAEVRGVAYPASRRVDLHYDLRRTDGTVLYSGPWSGLWEGMRKAI